MLVLPKWLARPSTEVAPDLLGCYLVRRMPSSGEIVRGLIVETEAYSHDDPACHGFSGCTPRNKSMFSAAGIGYVYFIYGVHHCFNVVTDKAGVTSAVLIRALHVESPQQPDTKAGHRTAAGPGKLCKFLKIDRSCDGLPLDVEHGIWLEHRNESVKIPQIVRAKRIGLTKAADHLWRWYLKEHPSVSK